MTHVLLLECSTLTHINCYYSLLRALLLFIVLVHCLMLRFVNCFIRIYDTTRYDTIKLIKTRYCSSDIAEKEQF